MNSRRIIVVITIWIAAAIVIGAIFFGPTLFSGLSGGTGAAPRGQATAPAANPIVAENARIGTPNWQIQPANESIYQIQAYAGATSVAPGGTITFYVSVIVPDLGNYTIEFYRLGWYGGSGARLMKTVMNNKAESQGFYGIETGILTCMKCLPDRQTGLLQANWDPSYTLTVPADWTSGVYFAKFTDAKGFQTYAPFDVVGNLHSTYVVVTPDTTAEAYNQWGGASLYEEDAATVPQYKGITVSPGAGIQQVSFNKPYADGDGSGLVLVFELPTIRWLEREGYDVSYISSTDLDQHPEQLLNHKAFISIGHDEYWTMAMRKGVEAARDHGVGLLFLGANTGYWQMRFEPGTNDRVITCYKVLQSNNDYTRDPEYGQNNTLVTSQWRDPVVGMPENAVTGVMFSELTHAKAGFAWTVDAKANSPLLANTGLKPGQSYGCGIVGYEWDRVFNQPTDDPAYVAATPRGIQILSSSTVIPHDNQTDGPPQVSNSAYYIAPSGALVFASGSIYFGNALDNYRDIAVPTQLAYQKALAASCGGSADNSHAVPEIQALMANVMAAAAVQHPSGHL